MGQKIEDIKGGKKNESGEKKSDASIVFNLDLHCEGWAQELGRVIRHTPGVEKVKFDCETRKMIIKGGVDPTWLREMVLIKTKKTVELISSPPQKKKKTEDKKAYKETPASSVVALKIQVNCDGCARKVKEVIKKFKGVHEVKVELEKNLFTVKGTMDKKELTPYLIDKLKKNVEVVPSKKDNEGGNDKKEKQSGGGSSGGKKEKGGVNKKDRESKVVSSGGGVLSLTEIIKQKDMEIAKLKAGVGESSGVGPGTSAELSALQAENAHLKEKNARLTAQVHDLKDKLIKSHEDSAARMTILLQNLTPKP